jgi:hypothetical protein
VGKHDAIFLGRTNEILRGVRLIENCGFPHLARRDCARYGAHSIAKQTNKITAPFPTACAGRVGRAARRRES